MASNDYRFHTTWRVEATPDEVSAILAEPTELPRWWPSVYLEVREVGAGQPDGVGRVHAFYTKGWLPYTLRWSGRVTELDAPRTIAFDVFGDFEGAGRWTLAPDGAHTVVEFEWAVRAEKPLLRDLSSALRAVFKANHDWAMARGEEALKLEILRRRASSSEERAKVSAPRRATTASSLPLILGAVGTVAATVAAVVLIGRRPRDV